MGRRSCSLYPEQARKGNDVSPISAVGPSPGSVEAETSLEAEAGVGRGRDSS
jgi:hypothetical protein